LFQRVSCETKWGTRCETKHGRTVELTREFSIDKGEMTPTLKIKRGVIDEKYDEATDEICGS
jgi:long-subunit acyl-CoA synthetase (AMP-forming)